MKLIRFGTPDLERPGIQLQDGRKLDASAFFTDWNESFFAANGIKSLAEWYNNFSGELPPINPDERIGPPLARPSKMICVGFNYRDHAAETNFELPTFPIIFQKATSAICGPYDSLLLPPGSESTDWEVELAIIIGRKATCVTEKNAYSYIAGYTMHNDYTERAYQFDHGGQYTKGKGWDSFAPLGPFLVTPDEIPDPHNLNMYLWVNNLLKQNSSTSHMIFNIPFLVSHISHYMTLLPGDIISTGTPSGVGYGRIPPEHLKIGDKIRYRIDLLGEASQTVKKHPVSRNKLN